MSQKRMADYETVRARVIERGLLLHHWEAEVGEPREQPRECGTITQKGFTDDTDDNGQPILVEHREMVAAIVECSECGKLVECLADTDCFTESDEGTRVFRHTGYGPAMGECCGLLFADSAPGGPMMAYGEPNEPSDVESDSETSQSAPHQTVPETKNENAHNG